MSARVKQSICICCAGITRYVSYSRADKAAADYYGSNPDVKLNYDVRGNYWCAVCWDSPARKTLERAAKLAALANDPNTTAAERLVARMRLEEMLKGNAGAFMEWRVREARAAEARQRAGEAIRKQEEEARRMAEALKEAIRQKQEKLRLQRIKTIALVEVAIGNALTGLVAPKLALTGPFFNVFGIALCIVGSWFFWRPRETRVTIWYATAIALWMSVMAWLSTPFTEAAISKFSGSA